VLVCAAVEDEFPFVARQCAQFQPSVVASKERIVLLNLDWTFTRDGRGLWYERVNALDVCFDLDIARHGV
jgi:hypothetical protein